MTSSLETSEVGGATVAVDALRSSDMIESVEDGVASDGTGSTASSTAIGGGCDTTTAGTAAAAADTDTEDEAVAAS